MNGVGHGWNVTGFGKGCRVAAEQKGLLSQIGKGVQDRLWDVRTVGRQGDSASLGALSYSLGTGFEQVSASIEAVYYCGVGTSIRGIRWGSCSTPRIRCQDGPEAG